MPTSQNSPQTLPIRISATPVRGRCTANYSFQREREREKGRYRECLMNVRHQARIFILHAGLRTCAPEYTSGRAAFNDQSWVSTKTVKKAYINKHFRNNIRKGRVAYMLRERFWNA